MEHFWLACCQGHESLQERKTRIESAARFLKEDAWRPWVREEENTPHYHRTCLFQDPSQKLELVLITWLPGHSTLMHGHPLEGCLFLVLQGQLTEMLSSGRVQVLVPEDGVRFIEDSMGHHQVFNHDPLQTAVSLHLYPLF